jgi:inward rectifier potassium channel
MVIAPFKKTTALMFRMVPYKNNQLTDAEVKITMSMAIEEEGRKINKFYPLEVDISKINTLNLSWTIVHVIDEKSPLWGFTPEDIKEASLQVIILVRAFDEAFSNTVIARTSYTSDEILYGARFKIMYEANEKGTGTILHIDRLDDTEKADLPMTVVKESQASA